MGEAGEAKKGKAKETDEAEKSRAVNVKESIEIIAESGVELAIEATAELTPTKPESNISSGTDSSEAMRSGEEQKSVDITDAEKNKSVDVAVTKKNKSDDTAQKIMFVDAAEEKNKEKIHADAIVTTQEGASGKIFVAPGPVEETSEVVAKKSESADLKEAEDVEDILNVEKKATDVKEVTGAKKGSSEDEAIRAQVEGILNVDQLTSLVKEALDIKKEVGEEKDKVSSAVKVEVKVPLATPEVSSLTKKVEFSPTDDEVVIVKEVIAKKFGDMTLSDYNSEEDDDYSLSEAETEDSLEWASETERTKAEDDLAEHKVGIDYIGAALDLAAEKAASFKTVQAALAVGDWILSTAEGIAPGEVSTVLSSVHRRVRKIRRSGERMTGAFRETINQSTLTVASLLSHPLSLFGWQLKPLVEAASKKVLLEEDLVEVEAELCNAETRTFEELNLSDYDSDLDADYSPSEESSSEDELEFYTGAEVSSVVEELLA